MRYAIISDIHANLEALKKVSRSIQKNDIDEIICLGDIVGYGPNPNECVERIRKMNAHVVVGNHDFSLIDDSDLVNYNTCAKSAVYWTRNNLTTENLKFLAGLPFSLRLPDIFVVHSSPTFPRNWNYVSDIVVGLGEFGSFKEKICFIGHSHVPNIFSGDGDCFLQVDNFVKNQRYIINVGSVGQPRDKDPRACYGILDAESWVFSLIRIEYNIRKTAKKIRVAGLPDFLAKRLYLGI